MREGGNVIRKEKGENKEKIDEIKKHAAMEKKTESEREMG